jgi:hypothetical protein
MKPAKVREEETFIDEILETLKSVPKTRLRIVRDVIGALAEPSARDKGRARSKRRARRSLLNTPFCGMWQDRTDIDNGRSFASTLRQRLENRGDRAKNLR